MTSSRQNKNSNSRLTPTATSTKRNFTGSTLLVTSVNTPSTASATPVQQASHVDQISDLPTLPNKNDSQRLKSQLQKTMRNSIRNSEIKESRENIKTSVLENLQKTGLPLEKIERNIDKLHWVGRFDHETQMQPIIVKFRTHSFKEKIYHQRKKLAKGIKISLSLTKRRSDIL